MSGDPGVLQSDAALNDGPHVGWSVLRAGVFGLTAAVAGAGLYAAVVIVTGYEVGLVAIVLGLGVGFAVAAGHARLAEGWVRALSIMLTLFSLLLSSYLILWLYDGEGFAPVPISVGEAAAIMWDLTTEEPERLLFWGLALLTAFGIGKGEDTGVDEHVPAHTILGADPSNGTDRSGAVVQVVRVEPHPLRAADLDLAVVMRTPTGEFRLRRLSLVASDLPGALPHLFDADPDVLARGGTPVNPCQVVDHAYDSAEEAMAAAYGQQPPADPHDWVDGADFCLSVEDDPEFAELLKPGAERIGGLGTVAVGLGGLAVAAAVTYAGYRLNVWVGLDTPERKGTLPDTVFTIIAFALAGVLALRSGRRLARLLARRNLAKATAQGWMPSAEPDEVQREVGAMSDDNADPRRLSGRADTPATLVERPRVRLFWCAGALVLAAFGAVMGIAARDELGDGGALAFVGAAIVLTLLGVACLRWSIVADESGVTVTNLFRRHRIPWPDLEDVRLEKVQADIDLGFHYIVFITSGGNRIRADAPTGRNQPGAKMPQLEKALLDMRNLYAPSP